MALQMDRVPEVMPCLHFATPGNKGEDYTESLWFPQGMP